ncbi:sulfurtransferase TusA family protein [Desulfomicrobium orale]|uniref:UPF0033 domain-containing protein n=1 Tax=Desulfomicrobium orale DSM 12838 TaxID=888061 RepID=A0A109W5B7_9BACT|nr:sulfurtransferase TusA family protein [Desulfomicrobium orale]AMD91741.1 hypothetical protein AXF15_00495 [Desulfomicrobium orale DSM 12838]
MKTQVDACGLSCPQPVLLAMRAMEKAGSGSIEILVDNEASRENVSRAARAKGWAVSVHELDGNKCRLELSK